MDEKRSTKLNKSPPNINKLFKNSNPPQKKRYCEGTAILKVSIRNAAADARSIPPRILTSIEKT